MILKYNVTNQRIERTGKEVLANRTEKYLQLEFQFSNDWDTLTKFMLVLHSDGSATRLAIVNDEVVIPASLLTGEKLTFTLYGVKDITDGIVRITTHRVVLKLLESGYTDEYDNPIEDSGSTDIVEQIYAELDRKAYTSDMETSLNLINTTLGGLEQAINTINTDLSYIFDVITIDDFTLLDDTKGSITSVTDGVKISNITNDNQSVFFRFNDGTYTGNFKAIYKLRTSDSVNLYHRLGSTEYGATVNLNETVNYSDFVTMEWIIKGGKMTVLADGVELATGTYDLEEYYLNMAFYFNSGEYAVIKDFKVVNL